MSLPNITQEINYIKEEYFPLSGKSIVLTATKATEIFKSSSNSAIGIRGGSTMNNGAWIALRGEENNSNPGTFELKAINSIDGLSSSLLGKPDGSLTWGGDEVVTHGCTLTKSFKSSHPYLCSRNVDNDRLVVFGGTGSSDGSYIRLSGMNEISARAEIRTIGADGTGKSLAIYPNGDFKWGGNPVVVLVESYNSGATFYRKYSDGWIEQGGVFTGQMPASSHVTVTFYKSFSNTNYKVILSPVSGDTSNNTLSVYYGHTYYGAIFSKATASFVGRGSTNTMWYACGY